MRNMKVRSYRASTLRDALHLVRQDLGPDAAVLGTREVWDGWLRGLLGKRRVEVTALSAINSPRSLTPQPISDSRPSAVPPARRSEIPPAEQENYRGRLRDGLRDSTRIPSASLREQPSACQSPQTVPGRFDQDLGVLPRCRPTMEFSGALFELYAQLVDAEFNEDLARELVTDVRAEAAPDQLQDVALLRRHLRDRIEEQILIHGPIELPAGVRRLVALVGPTGVGKTTTIAKLAANFRLRDKRRVGLITVDTYRVAAVEQLRTYADIIDLPMEVVATPREMRRAVERLCDLDLVLLDTAGRSPRDEIKIQELKSMLVEAAADEVHLVLSATASAKSLVKSASQFADVGTTALLVTKLDEATGLGNLLPLIQASKLPLSYLTDGQNVPDDIQPADRRDLAGWMLRLGGRQ